MLKVIITDDEVQILKGLRMKVNWEEEGFQIVGEASNGQDTLELLQTIDVDVVITDIRMPIMDGIELAKRCQEEFPNIKVIVLSGYSEFDYVRRAMQEGVKDYLLKPVDPDELLEILHKVSKEIEEEKRIEIESARIRWLANSRLQEVQEQFLLYLVRDEWLEIPMIQERLKQIQLEDLGKYNIKVQFLTVEVRGSENNPDLLKERWISFQMLCKEIAKNRLGTYCFYNPNYGNVIHFLNTINSEYPHSTQSLINDIQKNVKSYLNLETVIGVGSVVTGLREFKNGYIASLFSWSQSQLGSVSQVIDEKILEEGVFQFSDDLERKLTNAIEGVDLIKFQEHLYSMLGETIKQSLMSFSFLANRVLFLLSSLVKKYGIETKEIQHTIWKCQQGIWEMNSQSKVRDYLIQLAKEIIEKVRVKRYSNGKLVIESILHYLNEHYASEISLTSLSSLFHINSAYLSDSFKNHVGQNFSEYLVNLRIEKAKQFLNDKELRIIDIAYLVGFSNSSYFSTVFKKHVGKTPIEYRNSIN